MARRTIQQGYWNDGDEAAVALTVEGDELTTRLILRGRIITVNKKETFEWQLETSGFKPPFEERQAYARGSIVLDAPQSGADGRGLQLKSWGTEVKD